MAKQHFFFYVVFTMKSYFGQIIPIAIKGDGTDKEEEIYEGKIQS